MGVVIVAKGFAYHNILRFFRVTAHPCHGLSILYLFTRDNYRAKAGLLPSHKV